MSRLIRTSRVDHADWNYRPLLAFAMRRRFALALSLMPRSRVHRMLEVGFGSGIFLPELARKCDELYGIDVHPKVAEVRSVLQRSGIDAALFEQDAAHMQFVGEFFDVIVSISAVEFIDGIEEAAREMSRVLAPSGRLIVVMPGKSAVLDWMLQLTTGESARNDYGDRRERAVPALLQHFRLVRTKSFIPVYRAYEFEKK